jgi:uncharacterized membrane protein
MAKADRDVPHHVQQTVDAIADIHTRHQQEASRAQRWVERAARWVARPRFLIVVTVVIVGWVAANLILAPFGRAFDPPPFSMLQAIGTAVAIYITVLILITTQREKEIANHREQLALQMAILSEQKSAKIIQLIEEARRDNPFIGNRRDEEARKLGESVDVDLVLDAIRDKDVLSSEPEDSRG